MARSLRDRIWSRREIEGQIAAGRKIIILDGQVIKADAWLPFHPGGDKAVLHLVGRDGTVEIRAFHSLETQAFMQKFVIGRIQGRWTNFVPPIQGGNFRPYNTEEVDGDEQEQDTDVTVEDQLSSSRNSPSDSSANSSSPASPIFEPIDRITPLINPSKKQADAMSISSVSSISQEDLSQHTKDIDPIETRTANELSADLLLYPQLDHISQDAIVDKYRAIDARLKADGLYKCPYWAYGIECCRYILIFSLSMLALRCSQFAISGILMGLFWHQLVFTAHDAGHMGITHDFHTDSCIGILIADFLGGLSIGWWKRNHNVHHIVTNHPEHDPDIEHIPFFAISTKFFRSLRSTYYDRILQFDAFSKWAISKQHWLYYPILSLGRFNLYRLSWEYVFFGVGVPRKGPAWWHRYLEILGHIFFWSWYGYGILYLSIPTWQDRLVFILLSHLVTGPLHVQITLSHFAMSTSDLGVHESFPQKMLRTTMDVDCPPWLDFVHGGLQFQAVHHLYPRLPRHNLRKAQRYVREFCKDVGIPYVIYGFTQGNREVIGRLEQVAKQVRIFEECRKVCAKEIVEGHH